MAELPAGTVTMLFTDIEGSTSLLNRLGDDYRETLTAQREIMRAAVSASRGLELGTEGDSFFVVFESAGDAVQCCLAAQRALAGHTWAGGVAVRVRMGLHSGEPVRHQDSYVGIDVHRAARIASAAHGGQVVLSEATRVLAEARLPAGVSVRDLGLHRLKDIETPERIYQLVAPGMDEQFPPLKSLGNTSSLPAPLTPLVGRDDELEQLRALIAQPAVRLVTLTGTGGIGKTRLALQAAADSADQFPDGIWWVGLAALTNAEQVLGVLAQALGVREAEGAGLDLVVRARLHGRRMLLVLDNAEHLLPDVARVVTSLLAASDHVVVLTTSRERLRLSAEHVYAVPPLTARDAAAFLRERAGAVGVQLEESQSLDALCARLDRVPLALELAAPRLRIFSPAKLLERIATQLDLFEGPRDIDPRHRTLRATIEWSYDLLTEPEQQVLRRFAVFVQGCTPDAAESVCESGLEPLDGLLGKSLLQRGDEEPEPRLRMLESVRGFAEERLVLADEVLTLKARHADYFRALAGRMDAALRAGDPEEGPVSILAADIGNLRAAATFGLESGNTQLVREITACLLMYWTVRGLYAEARSWLDRALALDDSQDSTRQRLLSALGCIAFAQGDHKAAVAASDEAASLAMELAGETAHFERLDALIDAAFLNEDWVAAEGLLGEALSVARAANNGVGTSSCRLRLAWLANISGRHDRAVELLAENLPFVRAKGQTRCEGYTLESMAETSAWTGRFESCSAPALLGARRALQIGDNPLAVACLEMFAIGAASGGDHRNAAAILAATQATRAAMGVEPDPHISGWSQDVMAQQGQAVDAPADLSAAFSLAEAVDQTIRPDARQL